MKIISAVFIVFLSAQLIFAQTKAEAYKIAEYDNGGGGCEEYFRMMDFIEAIKQQEGSRGLIVLYSGDSNERFGNILANVSGTKEFLTSWIKFPPEKVIYSIAEGKHLFYKELWIIPKDAKLPELKLASFDWNNLKTKYFYSTTCFQCEPSYPHLTTFRPGFDDYSNILKKHPEYIGLITVNNYEDLFYVRRTLNKEYRLPKNRFQIQFDKTKGDEYSISVNLYIVPKGIK